MSVESLPPAVDEALQRFCASARDTLTGNLVALILYGGVARGEYQPDRSDVNLLIVLRSATMTALDALTPLILQGRRDFALEALVLTEDELRSSADVFPTKFLGMKEHHRVLHGVDILTGLEIAPDRLRLRCEQELRNLLLRLRKFYLYRADRTELIESTLAGAVSSLTGSLAIMLKLRTGDAPAGKAEIASAAAGALGLDCAPLVKALALKTGDYQPEPADLRQLYAAFMALVEQTAAAIDELEVA